MTKIYVEDYDERMCVLYAIRPGDAQKSEFVRPAGRYYRTVVTTADPEGFRARLAAEVSYRRGETICPPDDRWPWRPTRQAPV